MNRDPSFLRQERAKTVELVPMIGSVGLFLQHNLEPDLPYTAATNGKEVKFAPNYFDLPLAERNGVLLHEYLHVALSHNHRATIVARKEGASYDAMLMNVAMDMFINRGITRQFRTSNYIRLPQWVIRWEVIEEELKAYNKAMSGSPWETMALPSFENATCEKVYAVLKLMKKAANDCISHATMPGAGDEAGEPTDGQAGGGKQAEGEEPTASNDNEGPTEAQVRAAERLVGKIQTLRDIEEMVGKSIPDLRREIDQNTAKLENAMRQHGTRAADLIEQLRGDLPEPQVPWQTEFRSRTQRHLSRTRAKHHSKPARSVLSQVAMGHKSIMWNSGRKRPPIPRAALVIDSSGSVNMDTYKAYLTEVDALIKRTNAEVTVIIADAEIQAIYQIRSSQDIPKIEFKGRGGTDFRPALQWIDERDYDLAIYLTDLGGTFPEKTTTPLLWVGPENPHGQNQKAPIGRTIWIEQ